MRLLLNFVSDIRANLAVPATMGMLGAATLSGGLYDFMSVSSQRAELQGLADAAALNAVREMAILRDNAGRIEFVAEAYVASAASNPNIKSDATADLDRNRIAIEVSAPVSARFPGPFSRMDDITVYAQAELLGRPGNICMIGLDDSSGSTLKMSANARITADDCGIYSNSTSTSSVHVTVSAQVKSELICAAGGFFGNENLVDAEIITDCPSLDDPLSARPLPYINDFRKSENFFFNMFAAPLRARSDDDDDDDDDDEGRDRVCDHRNKWLSTGQEEVLSPGVYCGGLTVWGGTAKLQPGDYIIKDGSLSVLGGGTLVGENVGFFMTGALSTITFTGSSTISLTAPTEGAMAGILFFEDPAQPVSTYHTISSDNARRMVGTIYIPRSKLLIQGNNPIADQSEYTIIVAREFELREGPNLVLKTDYHLTDIPVPDGVGPLKDMDARLLE